MNHYFKSCSGPPAGICLKVSDGFSFFNRSHSAHNMGAMQKAISIDPIIENVTAYASGLNNFPSMPCSHGFMFAGSEWT